MLKIYFTQIDNVKDILHAKIIEVDNYIGSPGHRPLGKLDVLVPVHLTLCVIPIINYNSSADVNQSILSSDDDWG